MLAMGFRQARCAVSDVGRSGRAIGLMQAGRERQESAMCCGLGSGRAWGSDGQGQGGANPRRAGAREVLVQWTTRDVGTPVAMAGTTKGGPYTITSSATNTTTYLRNDMCA